MPDVASVLALTCGGCGCACDDLAAVAAGDSLGALDGACDLGAAWFAQRTGALPPPARVGGVPAALPEALDAAAEILRGARLPLIFGLGGTSCEAQREAVALADAAGAVIDPSGPLLDGAWGAAFQDAGSSTATFGEIRDRAQVVVVWRADPVRTHPRLLERLRLDPRAPGRTLVVVDSQPTPTAAVADVFLQLPAAADIDALWSLRAIARGLEPGPVAGGVPLAALRDLAARLAASPHSAFLHDGALTRGPGAGLGATAFYALIRDIGRERHVVAAPLRREVNAAGAQDVLAWQTGYPSAVSLATGHPRSEPGAGDAAALLCDGAVDAALIVACDALSILPEPAAAVLRDIPVICIDAAATATAEIAAVALTPACAGIHRAGTVHRMDGVPIPLRAVLGSERPGDDELLAALTARLGEAVPA